MSDTDTIHPALTAWEAGSGEVRNEDGRLVLLAAPHHSRLTVYDEKGRPIAALDRRKAAALCLNGQPFGFTKDEVTALRESAEDDHAAYCHYATLLAIAAKITALLPPE